ncbi:MAG: hypothetical protein ABSC42_04715 [Tepidisphaeraceae bacterium]|jgi:hypothetical protein
MILRRRRNTGFAMVTAIFLISFTVMTLTVLMATIAAQSRRAQILGRDAQLRQLLTAGAAFADAKLQSDSSGRFSVPLPDSLRQLGADLTVEIQPPSDEKATADIQASLPHHYLSQRLTFSRQENRWRITDADLD